MMLVLILAAAIWFGGRFLGAPRGIRAGLLGLLFVAVLGVQFTFPPTHPLRIATGGSAALWLIFAGFVAMFLVYRQLLGALRRKADTQTVEPARKGTFSDTELNIYYIRLCRSHHVLVPIADIMQSRFNLDACIYYFYSNRFTLH